MNLEGFDTAPPPPEEFRRVGMHDFGYAPGFHHEHQRIKREQIEGKAAVYKWAADRINHTAHGQRHT